MPRKGENIYKRKDRRWEGRYIKDRTPTGKAVYGYVYAKSYQEIRKKLNACRKSVEEQKSRSASLPQKEHCVFEMLSKLWLQYCHNQVKVSTFNRYRNIVKNYLLPALANVPCNEITYQTLEQLRLDLMLRGGAKGNGLAPKTVSDILSVLKMILRYGERIGVDVQSSVSDVIVKKERQPLSVLTVLEQQTLQQYLSEHLNYIHFGILLSLYTGLRLGELCALKWEDIDLQEKTLHVHKTMQRVQRPELQTENLYPRTYISISSPKSSCSDRIIPLPDFLVHLIKTDFPNETGFVLTGDEKRYIEPRSMQNHFHCALRNCGIRQVNFHTLRHTFATRCIECGFDIKSLSEILGHANVTITMNRYVHPTMDLKMKNMNRLSELFIVR